MKTIDEILSQYVILTFPDEYKSEMILLSDVRKSMQEYGKQVAEAQREVCENHKNEDWYTRPEQPPLVTDNI